MRGPLLLVGGMALFGSALLGANSLFTNLLHIRQPKIQVVQGSFGSTRSARGVYNRASSVSVIDGNGNKLP